MLPYGRPPRFRGARVKPIITTRGTQEDIKRTNYQHRAMVEDSGQTAKGPFLVDYDGASTDTERREGQ